MEWNTVWIETEVWPWQARDGRKVRCFFHTGELWHAGTGPCTLPYLIDWCNAHLDGIRWFSLEFSTSKYCSFLTYYLALYSQWLPQLQHVCWKPCRLWGRKDYLKGKAAAEFGISHVTLSRRLKNPDCINKRGGKTKYTVEEEATFAKLLMCCADLFFFT